MWLKSVYSCLTVGGQVFGELFFTFYDYTCMTLHLKDWCITASLHLITEIVQQSPFLSVNGSSKSIMVFMPLRKVSSIG